MNDLIEIGLVLFVIGTIIILITHELELKAIKKELKLNE